MSMDCVPCNICKPTEQLAAGPPEAAVRPAAQLVGNVVMSSMLKGFLAEFMGRYEG